MGQPRRTLRCVVKAVLSIVGYGYRPGRAFWPALAVVLLGRLLVSVNSSVMPPTSTPGEKEAHTKLVPLMYSFEAFLPVVSLAQAAAFQPDMGQVEGWWLELYLRLHSFFGWLIGGMVVAALLGLLQKD